MFYAVSSVQGSQITARRTTDGRTICRDASQFKLVNTVSNTTDEQEAKEEAPPTIAASEEDKPRREVPYALPLTVEPNHMEETEHGK